MVNSREHLQAPLFSAGLQPIECLPDGIRTLDGDEPIGSERSGSDARERGEGDGVNAFHGCSERYDFPVWGLTFDMSGGPKGAKRHSERPLDGRVSRHGGEPQVRARGVKEQALPRTMDCV